MYAHIDPRGFEEFYNGKWQLSRKDVHLDDIHEVKMANWGIPLGTRYLAGPPSSRLGRVVDGAWSRGPS
jgi:hypothetical protein